MKRWHVAARPDFPIWVFARRIIRQERLADGRVKWLVEAGEDVCQLPARMAEVTPADGRRSKDDQRVA